MSDHLRGRREGQVAWILAQVAAHLTAEVFGGVFCSPLYPPIPPAHSAKTTKKTRDRRLESDQIFDHFLGSILGRFWAVLGRHLGVIFGTFGGQVGPSSLQNASWKLIFFKNVNFAPVLRFPIKHLFFVPQDGPPKWPQIGPRRCSLALEEPLFRSCTSS